MAEFNKDYMQTILDGQDEYAQLEDQAASELLTESYIDADKRIKATPRKKEELNYDSDGNLENDGETVTTLKEDAGWLLNTIGLGEYAPKVNRNGKTYFTNNKSFTDKSLGTLLYEYENAPEDPNASHLVYTLRKFNGLDDDGNPTFEYKNGVAKVSAYQRYKNQAVKGGWELVREKRFAGASEWEKEFNANGDVLKNRAYDSVGGNGKISGFGAGYTEVLKKDLLNGNDSEEFTREVGKANLERSKKFTTNYFRERAKGDSTLGKAFLTGAVKFATDAGDVVLDVLTEGDNKLLNFSQKEIDDWVGYDRRAVTEAMTESLADFKRGDYASAILRDAWTKGQVVTESLPMMVAMGYSGGSSAFMKASKELVTMNKELHALRKVSAEARAARDTDLIVDTATKLRPLVTKQHKYLAEMTSKYGEKAVGSVERASTLPLKMQVISQVSEKAGLLGVTASATNDIIDQRIAGGDIHVDAVETMSIFASQFLALGLDKFAFDKIAKVGEIKEAFKAAFSASKTTDQANFLRKLTTELGDITKGMGAEAGQEYLQTWTEILGVNLGVNGKGVVDVLLDDKNKDEALSAMLTGATAGGITHATGTTFHKIVKTIKSGAVGSTIDAATTKVKDYTTNKKLDKTLDNATPFMTQVEKDINADDFDAEGYTNDFITTMKEDSLAHPSYQKANEETKKNIKHLMVGKLVTEYVRKISNDPTKAEEYKVQLLKVKESGLLENSSDSFVSNIISNVVEDINNRVENIKGSDINSKNPADDVNKELNDIIEGKNKPKSKGPISFLGKFDDLIEKYSAQQKLLKELGTDTSVIDKALKTLHKYNTTKSFSPDDKAADDVSTEIGLIGFVDPESGKIVLPSIEAYKVGLKDSILTGNVTSFVSLPAFKRWAKQRREKATNEAPTAKRQVRENTELMGVVDSILKDKSIDETTRQELELAKDNLTKANTLLTTPMDNTKPEPKKPVAVPDTTAKPEPKEELLSVPIKKRLAVIVASHNNSKSPEHKAKLVKLAESLGISKENLKKEFYDKLSTTTPKLSPEEMIDGITQLKKALEDNKELDVATLKKYKQFLVDKAITTISKLNRLNKRSDKVKQVSKMEEIFSSFLEATNKILAQIAKVLKREKKEISSIETVQKYIDTLESGKSLHHMSRKKLANDLGVTPKPKNQKPVKPSNKVQKEAIPIGGSENETVVANKVKKQDNKKERKVFNEDQGLIDNVNTNYIEDTWTLEQLQEVATSNSSTKQVVEMADYIGRKTDTFTPKAPEQAIVTITTYFDTKTKEKPKPSTPTDTKENMPKEEPKPKPNEETKAKPTTNSNETTTPTKKKMADEEFTGFTADDTDPEDTLNPEDAIFESEIPNSEDMFDPEEVIFDTEPQNDFVEEDTTIDISEVLKDFNLPEDTVSKINDVVAEFKKNCT